MSKKALAKRRVQLRKFCAKQNRRRRTLLACMRTETDVYSRQGQFSDFMDADRSLKCARSTFSAKRRKTRGGG